MTQQSVAPGADSRGPRRLTVAVASGKGGTGKTLVATGLAALAALRGRSVTLVDCDVEAPNDHLFLPHEQPASEPVYVPIAEVDANLCTACGTCRTVCAYGAPRVLGPSAIIFEEMCHGCGLCVSECPMGAIREVPRRVGEIIVGSVAGFDSLRLASGRLDIGQVKAPAIIRQARATAESAQADLTLLDAPPGVACSAVASVRGADFLVLVTEPTPFGLHDLALARRLGADLGIPMGIIVNRDTAGSNAVHELSEQWRVPIIGRIPFDRAIAEAYAEGTNPALEIGSVREAIEGVLEVLSDETGTTRTQLDGVVR